MSFSQVISILQARRKTAFLIFAVIVGATFILSVLMPRQFVATTQVVIDLKPDPVNGGLPPGMMMRPYLKTQAQIIESERLRLMVVDRLSLTERSDFLKRFAGIGHSGQVLRLQMAEKIGSKLRVTPGQDSTFLTISYRSHTPEAAAEVANAFAQAFIDTNIEMRTKPAAQRRDWYVEQSSKLRVELDLSQQRLTDFQRAKNMLISNERENVGQQRLQALSGVLLEATNRANDLGAQTQQATAALAAGNAETIPQILNNPSIQRLRQDRANLRNRFNEQLTVLGRQHPQMRRLSREIWSVGQRIKSESETVISGMEKARDAAVSRRDRLSQAMASQKGDLLTDKNTRESLSLLQRDVQNAQRAYDDVLTQLNRSSLQSASTYANVFVMSPALAPTKAASPNLLLNTALAIFLGTLLAIGLSLLMELLSRRVHSQDDLKQATGKPMIGSIGSLRKSVLNPIRHAS